MYTAAEMRSYIERMCMYTAHKKLGCIRIDFVCAHACLCASLCVHLFVCAVTCVSMEAFEQYCVVDSCHQANLFMRCYALI